MSTASGAILHASPWHSPFPTYRMNYTNENLQIANSTQPIKVEYFIFRFKNNVIVSVNPKSGRRSVQFKIFSLIGMTSIYLLSMPAVHAQNVRKPATIQPSHSTKQKLGRPTPHKVASTDKNVSRHRPTQQQHNLFPRLAAEFEPQRAIMFSVCDLQPHNRNVLQQIVKKTNGHANLLILYNNNQQLRDTVEFLLSQKTPLDHISFYKLALDTVWLRDFDPQIAEDESGARSVDFYYYGVRPFDDSFPERWALNTSGTVTKIPWTIQGGNLITNGQGFGVTTKKIFADNKVSFGNSSYLRANDEGRGLLVREMKQFCNLKELAVLEPLRNESTKHVDMFAAFVSRNHVLVAQVDPKSDATNAKVLDWNARKLASFKVDRQAFACESNPNPCSRGLGMEHLHERYFYRPFSLDAHNEI